MGKLDVSRLEAEVRGSVVTPGSDHYHESTRMFNAALRSEPAVVVFCACASDVSASLRWALENSLRINVRSGGCGVTGFGTNIGGVVIDVSRLNAVDIDPATRTARVGAGVRLGTLYAKLAPHNLVIPGGECANVGASGLVLGGGISLIGRSHGFTVDALEGVEFVLANGDVLEVGDGSHDDLFWALRGGGGSFGVATELRFRLSPLPAEVPMGMLTWNEEQAPEAMSTLLDYFHEEAPDELDAMLLLTEVPYDGKPGPGLAAVVSYAGEPDEGRPVLDRLRSLVPTGQGQIVPSSYHNFLNSHYNASRQRDYELWKSAFVADRLPTEAARELVAGALEPHQDGNPSPDCLVSFELCGGKMNRVGRTETAFVHRDQRFLLGMFANSSEASEREKNADWVRRFHRDLSPYFSGEAYQNYPDMELPDFRAAYYAENYDRLVAIKRQVDPGNVFRFGQSIGDVAAPPASEAAAERPQRRPRPDDAPDA